MAKKKTDTAPPAFDDVELSLENDEVVAEAPAAGSEIRVCDPDDRAANGLKRFKFRLDGHPGGIRSQRYVLAPDRDSAEACYLDHEKLDPSIVDDKAMKLVVTELAD